MILNMKDLPGGKLPPNAVYVGRPRNDGYQLHWGNPFEMENEDQRGPACDFFYEWMQGTRGFDTPRLAWVRKNIILLHSRDLVCWCAPKRCHAETLTEFAAKTSNKPVFRVIVAGGRDFHDYDSLARKLDELLSSKKQSHTIVIISGMADGADKLGARYGRDNCYHVAEFPAFWDEQGKSAGFKRNAEMRKYADAVVCFWDGKSKGTQEMINESRAASLPTRVISY